MTGAVDQWLGIFARVAPVVALHPIFGGRGVPGMVKASVAVVLATALWTNGSARIPTGGRMALVVSEAVIGFAVAAIGVAVFGAIESAGRFVDDARGANSAKLFAPHVESSTSPLGALDATASLALFWAVGHHAVLLSALAASFDSVPLGEWPDGPVSDRTAWLTLVVEAVGSLARAGLSMAGPAAAATVTVDAILGLVGRTSPQANVFTLSLPAKLVAALAVTALAMPGRVAQWGEVLIQHDVWVHVLLGG